MPEFEKVIQEDFTLYNLKDEKFPKNTFILSSKESREILYNPQIAGKKLQDLTEKMSKIFARAISKEIIKGEKKENLVEFILLAGALYYNLNYGFKEIQNFAIPQCFLGIKRKRIQGTDGEFEAIESYENFESLNDNSIVIMGDTIASGTTIVKSIKKLFEKAKEKNKKIKKLIIFSIACSSKGAEKIKELENELNAEICLIVCEQLFHLMPDGTDLRFLRENAVYPKETEEYTLEKYGEFLGKNMKCAVFDWGTRCKNPKEHYKEFLEFCKEILKNPEIDEKGKNEILRMEKEVNDELNKLKEEIL